MERLLTTLLTTYQVSRQAQGQIVTVSQRTGNTYLKTADKVSKTKRLNIDVYTFTYTTNEML